MRRRSARTEAPGSHWMAASWSPPARSYGAVRGSIGSSPFGVRTAPCGAFEGDESRGAGCDRALRAVSCS